MKKQFITRVFLSSLVLALTSLFGGVICWRKKAALLLISLIILRGKMLRT